MKALMLSSSKYLNNEYLSYAKEWIDGFLSADANIIFVPFAGVTISYDEYTQKVQQALPDYSITGLHQCQDPKSSIANADAIIVGGGNTFRLLYELYSQDLIASIKSAVENGSRYIGWSAGSNLCGKSIRTTNDMPIIEPPTFDALGFIDAQINPHYTDYHPEGFHGETRDQRIMEFSALWPNTPVIGLREGSALLLQDNKLKLLGDLHAEMFLQQSKTAIKASEDISHLIK